MDTRIQNQGNSVTAISAETKKVAEERNADALTLSLLEGKENVALLDLAVKTNAIAFLNALSKKSALAQELQAGQSGSEDVLVKWVTKNSANFLELPTRLYTEKIVSVYAYEKIKQTADKKTIFVLKSFDDKPVVNVKYKTYLDEGIAYFDEDIRMPTKIEYTVFAKIKIVDALRFLNALDIAVGFVDANCIADFFNAKIQLFFRKAFTKYIVQKKIGYFHISEKIEELTEYIRTMFAPLSDIGIVLTDFTLNSIRIPNSTNALLEEQYYLTRKKESEFRIRQMQTEFALKNYEKRAEICAKYPEFAKVEETPTAPAFSLERYLYDYKFNEAEIEEFARDNAETKNDFVPTETEKPKREKPEEPQVPIKPANKIGYLPLALFLFADIIGIVLSIFVNAVFGSVVAVAGIVAGAIYIISHLKKSKKMKAEYNIEMEEYNKKLSAYQLELAEYNAEVGE